MREKENEEKNAASTSGKGTAAKRATAEGAGAGNGAGAKPETGSKTEPETGSEAEPKGAAESKPEPTPAPKAQREPEPTPEPSAEPKPETPARSVPVKRPELHSGHKLARRYQLEECVTRVDGFSSWRAVDEKLRRAVGIHILPADHTRGRQVLAAARSAALLGDPRFVQVLDAVEENDLVYVIHEWLPDATALSDLLAAGPLEPHDAYQMVSQVSQAMTAAHREGLAHLRLDPGAVLRTVSGQYRIRGLAVTAALRGLKSDRPQRQDTEAIGALLYASLTQRWPYEEDAHGLTGLPKGVGLVAPDQVRAGIHRGLSEVAMRALVNDGATASREEPPCTTPEELAKAVAGMPRIRKPEQAPPVYQPPAFQKYPPATPPPRGATRTTPPVQVPPPALPGRTGQALKWAVAALLIVAIGLGSWQLADALKSNEDGAPKHTPTGQKAGQNTAPPAPKPIAIATAKDFDPYGDDHSENPSQVPNAYDNNPSTYWQTSWYTQANLGGLKPGVGVIVDLGHAANVSKVKVDFIGSTSVQLLAAPSTTSSMPTTLDGFTKVAEGSGEQVTLTPTSKVSSRYLLVWLTKLPQESSGTFRGKIGEISVTG
ncbi:serine/threonine protein kinase [Actinacidiphila acidipaludis]|nr:serine/threonine protein kinase [Streptomyces acidipaludis]